MGPAEAEFSSSPSIPMAQQAENHMKSKKNCFDLEIRNS